MLLSLWELYEKWREHHSVDYICSLKETTRCKKKGVFNTPQDLYQHLLDNTDTCLLHRALAMYIRHLYPNQVKSQQKKTTAKGDLLNFHRIFEGLVSLPKIVKNIPMTISTFQISR